MQKFNCRIEFYLLKIELGNCTTRDILLCLTLVIDFYYESDFYCKRQLVARIAIGGNMFDEIEKLAYCPDCNKNVPHCRRMTGPLSGLLQALRIGPWFCFNCQRKRLILPTVRHGAQEYRNDQPSDPVDSNTPQLWSYPRPASKLSGSVEMAESDFDDNDELPNSLDSDLDVGDVMPTPEPRGGHGGSQTLNDHGSQIQPEAQSDSKISLVIDEESTHHVDVTRGSSFVLEEADRTKSTVSDSRSERHKHSESETLLEAEPVGNFIKERSLVLRSTRMDRFTEKFRDSVVDRILAGKVTISSLVADGDYCESELESWIADKAKRQEGKTDTLDLDAGSQWSEQRREGGRGPLDPC